MHRLLERCCIILPGWVLLFSRTNDKTTQCAVCPQPAERVAKHRAWILSRSRTSPERLSPRLCPRAPTNASNAVCTSSSGCAGLSHTQQLANEAFLWLLLRPCAGLFSVGLAVRRQQFCFGRDSSCSNNGFVHLGTYRVGGSATSECTGTDVGPVDARAVDAKEPGKNAPRSPRVIFFGSTGSGPAIPFTGKRVASFFFVSKQTQKQPLSRFC